MNRRARAGLTFLEVIISIVMLTTVIGMLSGAAAFMQSSSAVLARRAEAAEACHRIIVQHLQDPELLIRGPKRVELNGVLYGYEIQRFVLIEQTDEDGSITVREQMDSAEATLDDHLTAKLHQISVDVFLDDPDLPSDGRILASLSRVYNPINTDDPEILLRWINELMELEIERQIEEAEAASSSSGGGTGSGGGGGGGGR